MAKKINSSLNYLKTINQILNPEIINHKNNLLPVEKNIYLSTADL